MPNFKKNTSSFRMYGKSPMTKALVGKQNNLPAQLKAKIEAAPESPAKMYDKKSPARKYGKSPMKEDKPTSYGDAYVADIDGEIDYDKAIKSYKDYNREKYGTTEPTRDAKKVGLTKKELGVARNIQPKKVTKVEVKAAKPDVKKVKVNEKVMEGKKTLGDTKLGNVKVGKNKKRLADTKAGKAFSKARAKAAASRAKRKATFDAAKAERKAKRDAKKSPAKKYAPGQAAAIYAQKADDAKKKKRK